MIAAGLSQSIPLAKPLFGLMSLTYLILRRRAVEGKSKVAEEVRPLFIQLINHVEIYVRNPRESQITTIVDAR